MPMQLTQSFYKLSFLMTIKECEPIHSPAQEHEGRQVDQCFLLRKLKMQTYEEPYHMQYTEYNAPSLWLALAFKVDQWIRRKSMNLPCPSIFISMPLRSSSIPFLYHFIASALSEISQKLVNEKLWITILIN